MTHEVIHRSSLPRDAKRVDGQAIASLLLGTVSACSALAIVIFMLVQGHEGFHDQGGMWITFILFPITCVAGLFFSLPALILGKRAVARIKARESELKGQAIARTGSWLGFFGPLVSIAALILLS